jgi:hypothetical protein
MKGLCSKRQILLYPLYDIVSEGPAQEVLKGIGKSHRLIEVNNNIEN